MIKYMFGAPTISKQKERLDIFLKVVFIAGELIVVHVFIQHSLTKPDRLIDALGHRFIFFSVYFDIKMTVYNNLVLLHLVKLS